jgi:hypothetical protein
MHVGKDFLSGTVDVGRALAVCDIAFRGLREILLNVGQETGNFMNIKQPLRRYESLLKANFTDEKRRNRYLSPTIQNEILTLLSNSVLKNVIAEISYTPLFSLILDTTQDVSKWDQVSIFVRHVNINEHKTDGQKLQIKESF